MIVKNTDYLHEANSVRPCSIGLTGGIQTRDEWEYTLGATHKTSKSKIRILQYSLVSPKLFPVMPPIYQTSLTKSMRVKQ